MDPRPVEGFEAAAAFPSAPSPPSTPPPLSSPYLVCCSCAPSRRRGRATLRRYGAEGWISGFDAKNTCHCPQLDPSGRLLNPQAHARRRRGHTPPLTSHSPPPPPLPCGSPPAHASRSCSPGAPSPPRPPPPPAPPPPASPARTEGYGVTRHARRPRGAPPSRRPAGSSTGPGPSRQGTTTMC